MSEGEDNGFFYDFGRGIAWGTVFAGFWGILTWFNESSYTAIVTATVFVSVVCAVVLSVQRERHKRINQIYELRAKRP